MFLASLFYTSNRRRAKFLYFYGENSVEPNERKRVAENPNVTVVCFKNSEHWVHRDAKIEFLNITLENLRKLP